MNGSDGGNLIHTHVAKRGFGKAKIGSYVLVFNLRFGVWFWFGFGFFVMLREAFHKASVHF